MIREATKSDVGQILDLGECFFDKAGWPRVATWDDRSVVNTLQKLSQNGVLLVAEEGGRVVGIAGAPIGPAYFNDAIRISQELFWYVDPETRGVGLPLMKALEAGCVRKGAHVHLQGAVSGLRDEALDRFYRRQGYAPAERYFIKRVQP